MLTAKQQTAERTDCLYIFINTVRKSAVNCLKFSSLPETCIFIIWTSRKSFIRSGHATDQKSHLGLIRLRIFKMRWVSVANDHLGPKSLISDSATRRSLWPLQYQSAALDDNEWQISKTLGQSSIQTHGQVSMKSYFDIWHFWKSYCWFRLMWGLDHRSRSRSRSRRTVLLGAGAGAGMLPRSRSRSRSRPKMSRLCIPDPKFSPQ